jgi:hypothetical protein
MLLCNSEVHVEVGIGLRDTEADGMDYIEPSEGTVKWRRAVLMNRNVP